MSPDASDYWSRATQALRTAETLVAIDPDAAASRAYYASFYAVSALFAIEGQFFTRHSAVKTAVHRDLVGSGRWPAELAKTYSVLMDVRESADYGGGIRVSEPDALSAVRSAAQILDAVRNATPGLQ